VKKTRQNKDLNYNFRRNFIANRPSPDQGNLCMVPPLWGNHRESSLQFFVAEMGRRRAGRYAGAGGMRA
jgi:hypothetical protein